MPWHLGPMKDVDGCDKPRGDAEQSLIRGFPNGETHLAERHLSSSEFIGGEKPTQGSEPSQYLVEKKTTVIPVVAASETG